MTTLAQAGGAGAQVNRGIQAGALHGSRAWPTPGPGSAKRWRHGERRGEARHGRHGGGAFSGKDPSKVDRSAAYMCRWVAKNIVAAGLAERCELQTAYAIGFPDPVSLTVDTFGTNVVDEDKINKAVAEVFSFKPADIISQLNLLRPIYKNTTNNGHFGRESDLDSLTWEKTNKVEDLKSAI